MLLNALSLIDVPDLRVIIPTTLVLKNAVGYPKWEHKKKQLSLCQTLPQLLFNFTLFIKYTHLPINSHLVELNFVKTNSRFRCLLPFGLYNNWVSIDCWWLGVRTPYVARHVGPFFNAHTLIATREAKFKWLSLSTHTQNTRARSFAPIDWQTDLWSRTVPW